MYLFGGRDLRHSGVQDLGYKDLGLRGLVLEGQGRMGTGAAAGLGV